MAKHTVTGIDVRATGLEWTQLKPVKGDRYEEVESPAARVGEEPFDLAAALAEQSDQLKGELHYALNASDVLLKVLDLPTTDPAELAEMVELQIDKYAPFPSDRMYVSQELLEASETSSRVLVAGVQKGVVDRAGEAFTSAGLRLERIDVDVLGWWTLIRDSQEPTPGRKVLLILDQTGTELILVDDQTPIYFASFGLPEDETPEEFMAGIAEEVQYTLASIEGEWGETSQAVVQVWHWGAVPVALDRLQRATGFNVSTHELTRLPRISKGIALRAASASASGLVDLIPQTWKSAEESRLFKQTLLRSTLVMLGIWLVALVGFVVLFKLEAKHFGDLQNQEHRLGLEVEDVEDMEQRIDNLKQFKDRKYSVLECLRETTILMPQGVELKNWTYRKSDKIDITGSASSDTLALEYTGNLENSALFSKVETHYVRRGRGGGTEFKYTAYLP